MFFSSFFSICRSICTIAFSDAGALAGELDGKEPQLRMDVYDFSFHQLSTALEGDRHADSVADLKHVNVWALKKNIHVSSLLFVLVFQNNTGGA